VSFVDLVNEGDFHVYEIFSEFEEDEVTGYEELLCINPD